jgi:hypothetical protein
MGSFVSSEYALEDEAGDETGEPVRSSTMALPYLAVEGGIWGEYSPLGVRE